MQKTQFQAFPPLAPSVDIRCLYGVFVREMTKIFSHVRCLYGIFGREMTKIFSHVRCLYGIFGWEMPKYTVIYGAYEHSGQP